MPSWAAILLTIGICLGPIGAIMFVVGIINFQDRRNAAED